MPSISAGIFQRDEFGRHVVNLKMGQANKSTDTVLGMHDGRTGMQIRQVADQCFGIADASPSSATLWLQAEQFLFGQDCDGLAAGAGSQNCAFLKGRDRDAGLCL